MPAQLTRSKELKILSFLKAPRKGHVKTRLAKSIGPKSALLVYRKLVERQLSELPLDQTAEIHYTPEDAFKEMYNWLGDRYVFRQQCKGELGMRLEHAVTDAFTRGAGYVICIGGDCPKLDYVHLDQAAEALKSGAYDVVFGPSEDGGYYLIGLNAPYPKLFKDIPWSTEKTLDESLKKVAKLELRLLLLETLYDVDEIADLNRATKEGLIELI